MNNLLRRCRHVHPDSLPGHVVRLASPASSGSSGGSRRSAGDLPGGGDAGEDGSLGVSGAAGRRRTSRCPGSSDRKKWR